MPEGTPNRSNGLVSESKGRAFGLFFLFLAGMVLLDQTVYFGGNALVGSGHWRERLLPSLASAEDRDLYLLGGCRAAINFDSKRIGDSTGSRAFNAAVVADGLGNIDFALGVLLSHHAKGNVVFVIDDGNWEEVMPGVRPEIDRRLIWWDLLDAKQKQGLMADYRLPPLLVHSGFWRFKGTGRELAKAFLQTLARKPPDPAADGYAPRSAGQNIIPNLARESEIRAQMRVTWRPSPFAESKIESFVQRALKGGLKPILVIAPMHRLRANDEVNRMQEARMRALAEKYGIGYLSYLDNYGALADNDTLWSDVGHMNRLGSETFSDRFSADLRRLMGGPR